MLRRTLVWTGVVMLVWTGVLPALYVVLEVAHMLGEVPAVVHTLGGALEQGWDLLLSALFSPWTRSLHLKHPQWEQLGQPQEQGRRHLIHLSNLPLD